MSRTWLSVYEQQIKPRLQEKDGCLVFTGAIDTSGYGAIKVGGRQGKKMHTHRVTYLALKGVIPGGLDVMHTCHNRPCCCEDHLKAGTRKENLLDSVLVGRYPRE